MDDLDGTLATEYDSDDAVDILLGLVLPLEGRETGWGLGETGNQEAVVVSIKKISL